MPSVDKSFKSMKFLRPQRFPVSRRRCRTTLFSNKARDRPAAPASPTTSTVEPPFHAEFVRGIQRFIETDALPRRYLIDGKRHRLIIHRRGTDVPMHVIRFERQAVGDLILRAGTERPSSGLRERNVGKAIDRERRRTRRRWNIAPAQRRAAGLLPTVEQTIDFQVDAERAARSNPGPC